MQWRQAILSISALIVAEAFAHGSYTERYIPIGLSPDSGRFTLQGRIDVIDAATHTLTLRSGSATHTVAVTDTTSLWLDRSQRRATTLVLNFNQLRAGVATEVRCARGVCDGTVVADWIKVEAPNEPSP
jgi:hypothetical protein